MKKSFFVDDRGNPLPKLDGMLPVTLHFFEPRPTEQGLCSDYRPFGSWRDYVVNVCLKCVEQYGEDKVASVLLQKDCDGYFGNVAVPYFSNDHRLFVGRSPRRIGTALFLRCNFGADVAQSLAQKLVALFPKVEHEVICV